MALTVGLRVQDKLNILASNSTYAKGVLSIEDCLNSINGTVGRSEQDSFNIWAGTSGLRTQDATNVKAGTVGLRIQDAINLI